MHNIQQAINAGKFRVKKGVLELRVCYRGQRYTFCGKTQAICKNRARDALEKMSSGVLLGDRPTLNQYMDYWLENYKKPSLEPSSYKRLKSAYIHQIKPDLGNKRLIAISTDDIQKLINDYTYGTNNKEPLAKSGLKRIIHCLGPCLKHAMDNHKITSNPCDGVVLPTESNMVVKTKEQFSLDDEQLVIFKELALSKDEEGNFCNRNWIVLLFMLSSGLRVGEALALRWEAVDFENNRILIDATVQGSETGRRIKNGTKTGKKAYLPINDSIREYLGYLKDYDKKHCIQSDYVVCTSVGTMLTDSTLGVSLKQLLAQNPKLPMDTTLHTLRHTFGSTLLRKGVSIEVVSKLMRHSSINITIQKYIHVLAQQEVSAMIMADVV